MNQNDIKEEFYPLTPSTCKKLRKANLSAAEWRFWIYLTEHDPWGDRYKELNPLDIMAECEMSKATYYRAKAKFQEEGLFDFQEEKVSFRNLTGISTMRKKSQKCDSLKNEKEVSKMIDDSQKCDAILKNETEFSKMRLNSQKRENEPPKPAPSKGSTSPQTIQTYSDLLKTLSEEARESFEKFCLKKIEECSFKIGSRKAWLNKHGEEYLQEFKELYAYAISNPEVIAPKVEIAIPTIEQLKWQYGSEWESAAIHFGLISPNSPNVENEETVENEEQEIW